MAKASSLSNIARIAHLSDLYLLGARPAHGRTLEPKKRIDKLVAALRAAQDAGAVHLVISGNLTELGFPEQFEALDETLLNARIDPERVTLVPGAHDAYTPPDAWASALEGPLARYRRTSACADGSVVERAKAFFLPMDVTRHQPMTRSAGELTRHAADALERRVRDLSGRGRPVVIVLHHSPIPHAPKAWDRLHGLRGGERMVDLLTRYPDLHVLHGHAHQYVDVSVDARRPRVLGAPAVVDDRPHAPRVRIYESAGSSLRPVTSMAGYIAA
jgi:3',5'-cyclic AMP phosphodiesterase CpdA